MKQRDGVKVKSIGMAKVCDCQLSHLVRETWHANVSTLIVAYLSIKHALLIYRTRIEKEGMSGELRHGS